MKGVGGIVGLGLGGVATPGEGDEVNRFDEKKASLRALEKYK